MRAGAHVSRRFILTSIFLPDSLDRNVPNPLSEPCAASGLWTDIVEEINANTGNELWSKAISGMIAGNEKILWKLGWGCD
jgi:hypothetical protein